MEERKSTFFIVQTPYHIDDPEVGNMLSTLGDIDRDNHYTYDFLAIEGKYCDNLHKLMKLVREGFLNESSLATKQGKEESH
jgi:hypothetical protein